MQLSNKTVSLKIAIVIAILLSSVVGVSVYFISSRLGTTSSGVHAGAPSFTIYVDNKGNYTAKDNFDSPKIESTNASYVIQSAINSLPAEPVVLPLYDAPTKSTPTINAPSGSIMFEATKIALPTHLIIPLGSRIEMYGEGISFQQGTYGVNGGTQINCTDPYGILWAMDCGTLSNGTYVTQVSGSELEIYNMEFIQGVQFANSSCCALFLNGASQGILNNVVVTSYKSFGYQLVGYGIKIDNWGYGGYWNWDALQVEGFQNGIEDYTNHLCAEQVGIGCSLQALIVWPNPDHHYYNLHVYFTMNVLTVVGGDNNFYVTGLHIESFLGNDTYYGWWASSNYTGKVIIDDVSASFGNSKVWSFYNSQDFEFTNVVTHHDTPPFYSTVTTPTLVSGQAITNTNPEEIEVHISGGAVSNIVIGGISTGMTSGTFDLFPNEAITVTYSTTPIWIWLGLANSDAQT